MIEIVNIYDRLVVVRIFNEFCVALFFWPVQLLIVLVVSYAYGLLSSHMRHNEYLYSPSSEKSAPFIISFFISSFY